MRASYFASAALALQLAMPLTAVAQPAPFAGKPFTDVAKTHPNYDAIEYLREMNILRGYEDGTYKPEQRISRAEFTILATNPFFLSGERVNDCVMTHTQTGATTVFFPDVPKDMWYSNAICAAKISDLINGYPDGTFRPGHTIIVSEATKIAAKIFLIDVRRDNDTTEGKWYTAYVQAMGGRNAIPSTVDSLEHVITRGEMAEMFYRLKRQITDRPATSWQSLLN